MKRNLLTYLFSGAMRRCAGPGPKLRGGNILACETWSFRDLIRVGKLDILGCSWVLQGARDSWDLLQRHVLQDRRRRLHRSGEGRGGKAGRVVTSYIIEGNLAMADE